MHDKIYKMIDEYLGENKRKIEIVRCTIHEHDSSTSTDIECEYEFSDPDHYNPNPLQSHGDGFVDALIDGFVGRFTWDNKYKSLKNLQLSRYEVNAKIKKNKGHQADAKVRVEVGIKTPTSKEILFSTEDVSLVKASTKLIRDAIEFMINCEETVKVVHLCLQEARSRGRVDSISKYTNDLVELVKITSYEEVLN